MDCTFLIFNQAITVPIDGICKEVVLWYETTRWGISILFRSPPDFIACIPISVLNDYSIFECKRTMATSGVFCFSPQLLHIDVYIALLSYTPCGEQFRLSFYKTTDDELEKMAQECIHEYTKKPIVYLDLDKTLFISKVDCPFTSIESFVSDYTIDGELMAYKEPFHLQMMIRPGTAEFLKRLIPLAHIFIITAGDPYYAREAVKKANERNWCAGKETVENVSIPLENLYCVRYKSYLIKKSFTHILPFPLGFNYHLIRIFAIDDNPDVWFRSLYQWIYFIPPFVPSDPLESTPFLIKFIDAMESLEMKDTTLKNIQFHL